MVEVLLCLVRAGTVSCVTASVPEAGGGFGGDPSGDTSGGPDGVSETSGGVGEGPCGSATGSLGGEGWVSGGPDGAAGASPAGEGMDVSAAVFLPHSSRMPLRAGGCISGVSLCRCCA